MEVAQMRVMAVDYGDARTGVAVSDESGTLTGDAWVIESKDRAEVVKTLVTEALLRGVSAIVVGYPMNMDGSVGPRASLSKQFAELLRERIAAMPRDKHEAQIAQNAPGQSTLTAPGQYAAIEVILWDERMTTVIANRILTESGRFGKKRKKTVDAVAASLILEGYLLRMRDMRNS